MCVARGAGASHGDRRADWVRNQVLGSAHAQCIPTVRFVADGLWRDGYVYVVILCTKAATMLVFFDPSDIDEKGDPRHVVELQRRAWRVPGPPTMRLKWAHLPRDIDVYSELLPGKTCFSQVEDAMAGGCAHRPTF